MDADLVIIDERLARRHAKRLGLALTGVLCVLLKAKERGLVPAIGPWVDRLRQGGIHFRKLRPLQPVRFQQLLILQQPRRRAVGHDAALVHDDHAWEKLAHHA